MDNILVLKDIRDKSRKKVDDFVNNYAGNGDEQLLFNFLIELETYYGLCICERDVNKITNHKRDYDYKTDKNICRVLLLYIRAIIRHNYFNDENDSLDDFYDLDAVYWKEHEQEAYLEFIKLLEQLGYQVSDEERSYYNGTYQAYKE
jgi:hypothetical protein